MDSIQKLKKRGFFLFLSLILCLFPTLLQARSLCAFILADTDSSTGSMAEAELAHLRNELDIICLNTGLSYQETIFFGSFESHQEVLSLLDQSTIDPDDCLIFFFIGHGYRKSKQTAPWPNLYFSAFESTIFLPEVIAKIKEKKARFSLVVADCCNNVLDGPIRLSCEPSLGLCPHGYRKLFLQTEGIVIAAAAKAGTYAYCKPNGHLYSEALWASIKKESTYENASWPHILKTASFRLQFIQSPYYEWEINN